MFTVHRPMYARRISKLQFAPLVLEHTLLQSHLLQGEFSICTLCCNFSQSLQFSFLVPPSTHHCWVDRSGMIWEACPAPLHIGGTVTRAQVTHPSTYPNWARCWLTSAIQREKVTIMPCAPLCVCIYLCATSKQTNKQIKMNMDWSTTSKCDKALSLYAYTYVWPILCYWVHLMSTNAFFFHIQKLKHFFWL